MNVARCARAPLIGLIVALALVNVVSVYPGVRLLDGSYDIPGFDVPAAAHVLGTAARGFPGGAVFVCDVAPGSPEATSYLTAVDARDQVFPAPDNGLLTYVGRDLNRSAAAAR